MTYKTSTFTTIFDDYNQKWTIRYFTPDVEGLDGTSGMEWDDPVTFINHHDAIAHGSAVVYNREVNDVRALDAWTHGVAG